MTNQPHQFKHRDIVRAVRAAEAAGMRDPTVRICLPNGTELVGSGKPDEVAAAIPSPGKAQPTASRNPVSREAGCHDYAKTEKVIRAQRSFCRGRIGQNGQASGRWTSRIRSYRQDSNPGTGGKARCRRP